MEEKNNRSNSKKSHGNASRKRPSASRVAQRKRKARRKEKLTSLLPILAVIAAIALAVLIIWGIIHGISAGIHAISSGIGKASQTQSDQVSQAEETPAVTEEASDPANEKNLPNPPRIDINSWEYILVNAHYHAGEYAPPQLSYIDDVEVDSRIESTVIAFRDDIESQGLPVYLSSGYRDYDTQSYLFDLKLEQGYTEEEAATIVAPPGTSEHQTGLALDITDEYREIKNEELENTETYQWMYAHCQEYGFILRFPKDKEDITGIIYEPWHFRYVGVEAATYIMENGLCLEEFIELYPEYTTTSKTDSSINSSKDAASAADTSAEGDTSGEIAPEGDEAVAEDIIIIDDTTYTEEN